MARPNTLLQYGRVVTSAQGGYVYTGQPAILVYDASGGLLTGSESDGTNISNIGNRDPSVGFGTQRASFTSGIADPSGSTEAATLVENTDTNLHRCYQGSNFTVTVSANAQVTFSVYAKAAGRQYFILGIQDSGNNGFSANFNLTGGSTGGQSTAYGNGSFISANVQAAASSFYKCTVIGRISTSAVNNAYLFMSLAGSSTAVDVATQYAGDGTSGATLWRPKITTP